MNGNKNNKLLYDPEEINRKKLERINQNIHQYEDVDDDEEENVDETEDEVEESNDNLENEETDSSESIEEVNNQQSKLQKTAQNVNKAVNAAKKGKEMLEKAKKAQSLAKVGAFIAGNPWILLVGGGAVLLFILLIVILGGGSSEEQSNYNQIGLYGYEYIELENLCEEVYVYDTPYGNDGTYPLEEYVAGVVQSEVGMMNDLTTYEVFAIAARTFALNRLKNSDSCSIPGNQSAQVFRPTDNELIIQATQNTRGLVLTRDGELFSTMYDAFCWTEKDDNYYYMCQGNYDTGEPLEIPVEWANQYVAQWSGQVFLDNPEYMSHGQGMSQHGVYYLSASEGYTRDEIFAYFYGSSSKLMSIYQTFAYNGEYALNPNDELYQGLAFLTGTSLEELMANSGSSVAELNSYLASVAQSSGMGTRSAVVGSAVSLIGSLAELGYKLPYQWGGKYYSIGASPNWGSGVNDLAYWCNNYATVYGNTSVCTTNYRWQSFDCSGFVNWALMNGFGFSSFNELSNAGVYQATETSNTIALNANRAVCAPGDVLVNTGHIMLIVGLDDTNKQYIVAESTGSRLNTGYGGVILDYESYGNTDYRCRSLESLYSSYGGQDEG